VTGPTEVLRLGRHAGRQGGGGGLVGVRERDTKVCEPPPPHCPKALRRARVCHLAFSGPAPHTGAAQVAESRKGGRAAPRFLSPERVGASQRRTNMVTTLALPPPPGSAALGSSPSLSTEQVQTSVSRSPQPKRS
jgi:hypothetical protein